MRWLVRLITPRGGLVLDAFGGSGTTGVAALLEGCSFVAAEADSESHAFACKRLAAAERGETIVRAETTEPRADEAQRALDLTVT
jgi:site-specific DNA-methyltransferase (adenine-specific)